MVSKIAQLLLKGEKIDLKMTLCQMANNSPTSNKPLSIVKYRNIQNKNLYDNYISQGKNIGDFLQLQQKYAGAGDNCNIVIAVIFNKQKLVLATCYLLSDAFYLKLVSFRSSLYVL